MKVAHITTIDLSLHYLLLNQLRTIQRAGYEVVGISAAGPDVPALTAAGVRHIAVPMTRNFTPGADLRALARLYRVLRRERFTIVHTHNPKPGLLGQLAARLAGVPVVVNTLHGFYFHDHMPAHWRRFYIAVEQIAARCSDHILSQNREDMATAIRLGICPPAKLTHLGNGIDLTRFSREQIDPAALAALRAALGLPAAGPVIGFVGRLVAEKGIRELLAAARQVLHERPTARFLIVGPVDQEKPDALTPAVAQEYGVAAACVFTGLRQDMPDLYALMDLFVLPSHREGFPRAPLEASAMGVPCVATDIRGCREAVEPGRNGVLVPLRDPTALARVMLNLLADPAQLRRLGAGGRDLALERFDERRVFERVLDTYGRLLAARGLPVPDRPLLAVEASP
jgi:glycosyltransferase involved in cell wall biosynthesis